jgi:hypothetical protein
MFACLGLVVGDRLPGDALEDLSGRGQVGSGRGARGSVEKQESGKDCRNESDQAS